MKPGLFIFLLFSAASLLFAGEISIEVSWDTFNRNQYKGVLVLPDHGDGVSEFIDGSKGRSRDGSVIGGDPSAFAIGSMNSLKWTIQRAAKGIYKLYIFPAVDDRPNKAVWSRDVTVRFTINGQTRFIRPASSKGNVWYALSWNGATGELTEQQLFFPVRHMIYGNARDALTGDPLEGVTVTLLELETGKPVEGQTTRTSADGFYLLHSFPLGRYRLTFQGNGYIETEGRADFMLRDLPVRFAPLMSPLLGEADFRVCLDWGEHPYDLDAHLAGPGENGGSFHISYSNMKVYNDRHFLDIDDKESFGPETITIGGLDGGSYRYSIHDFTNRRKSSGAWNLAESEAVVTLYRGSRQIAQFPVPQAEGTWWEVFSIDGSSGKVTPVGTMSYKEEP